MSAQPQRIWWRQVGRSLRLVEKISESLFMRESFVLSAPGGIPWEEDFHQRLKETILGKDSERMLRFLVDETKEAPGKVCLKELCPKSFADKWWPSSSPASYLCVDSTLPFHQMFVWVSLPPEGERLRDWERFVRDYEEEAEKASLPSQAVFVLERKGRRADKNSLLPTVEYQFTESDCHIFCVEELSDREVFARDYLAELALQLGEGNPLLCHALLERALSLLQAPFDTALEVLEEQGEREETLKSLIWRAQVRQFFPFLEERRMAFLQEGGEAVRAYLPYEQEDGKKVWDPMDLELKDILNLVRRHRGEFPGIREEEVDECRKARNKLAHWDLLSKKEIDRLLEMEKR